eukprot:PITA_33136
MIITSWNCRGLASKPKKLALREMLLSSRVDILLLQETLGIGIEVESALSALLPDWKFTTIDSSGHSGGLAVGYRDGRIKSRNQWGMKLVMGIEIQTPDFDFPLTILNIYGPCQGRMPFWNDLMAKSIVKNSLLVLGGDLNFSLGRAEIWGPSAREDSLTNFFQNLLTSNKLIDVNLIKLKPTWRNRRVGEARVAKRLDRFLINEDLSALIPIFRQWVEEGGPSDHSPIFLDLSKSPPKPPTSFKFNSAWLQEPSFNQLFKETWIHPDNRAAEDRGFLFMENLKRLKKATISWAKDWKAKQNEDYNRIRRKSANTIWSLKNGEGREAKTFEALSALGQSHFQNQYADHGEATIAEVIRIAQCFPRFVDEEEAEEAMTPVTKEEVEGVIKSMAKEKSPGPDGWAIELYLHFFDLIGEELIEVVEETRIKGEVYSPFNATFIALIPKKENP